MGLNEWLALIGALGGFEAIKWIVNFYVNRRTNARKEDATAEHGLFLGARPFIRETATRILRGTETPFQHPFHYRPRT